MQLEKKEKFLKTASTKPTVKNNFKQFKTLDLEKMQVEAVDCVPVPVAAQTPPEERWKQCYVSFEN